MSNIAHPLGQSPEVYAVMPTSVYRDLANVAFLPTTSANDYAERQKAETRSRLNTGSAVVKLSEEKVVKWQDQAICKGADPEPFFAERGESTEEAKQVCRTCPVRTDCLEYALVNGEKFGVWGGMSERGRRSLRKQRAQASKQTA